jgi:hypothetical protein
MTAECEEDQKGVQTNVVGGGKPSRHVGRENPSGSANRSCGVLVQLLQLTSAQHGSVVTSEWSLGSPLVCPKYRCQTKQCTTSPMEKNLPLILFFFKSLPPQQVSAYPGYITVPVRNRLQKTSAEFFFVQTQPRHVRPLSCR